MEKRIIVAVDGYSSCGKSTLAKDLAKQLHYRYIDTGAMYRAATLYFLEQGIAFTPELKVDAEIENALNNIHIDFHVNNDTKISETYLNGQNVESKIRGMEVAAHVSMVSAIKQVRKHMVALQQKMGQHKAIVMDGRDIGSVVFPNAELKLFMTASPDIRTKRRFDELKAKGVNTSPEEVRENIAKRDHDDTHREESPLLQAPDAIVVDNSHINQDEQLVLVLNLVKAKIGSPDKH